MQHEEDELTELRSLKSEAPADTVPRLWRRLRIVQAGRDLIRHQAWGFWIVLDTFLRLFLTRKSAPAQKPPVSQGDDHQS